MVISSHSAGSSSASEDASSSSRPHIKATDQILILLLSGTQTTAQIVFELDFRPSTVYGALTLLTSMGLVERHAAKNERASYTLTDHGKSMALKIGSPSRQRRTKTDLVVHALKSGAETYQDIIDTTGLSYTEAASALVQLKKRGKVVRTDPGGNSGRGNGLGPVARFTLCR